MKKTVLIIALLFTTIYLFGCSNKLENEWSYKYSIEVDGKLITDKDLEVNKRDFKIVFTENLNEEFANTNSLDEEESLKGDRQDHVKIIGIEPTNITWTDGTIVTALIYEFENVPKNTNFELELTDELKEKIGLRDSIINIHVK